jgi:putative PEP-CTERM system TPR-repeat lipoprotein
MGMTLVMKIVKRTSRLLALVTALALVGCGQRSEHEMLESARSFIAQRDNAAATVELKTLLQVNPASGDARFLLGKLLLDSGDPAGAAAELQRARDAGFPAHQLVPSMAAAMLAQRQSKEVIAQFGGMQFSDSQAMADLKVQLAAAYLAQNERQQADAAVEDALSRVPGHPEATVLRARLQADREGAAAALAEVNQLLARSPRNALAWQLKAELLLAVGPPDNVAPVVSAYREALAIQPDLIPAHAALLTLHVARRDFASAGQQWAELKKVRPNHAQTRFFDAVLALQRGDAQRARELCQGLLRVAPDNTALLSLAAEAELKLRSYATAESLASKAVRLQPKDTSLRRLLAEIALQTGQSDKAIAALKPLVATREPNADLLFMLGRAQFMANDRKGAEASLAKAASLKPDDHRIRTAVTLARAGGAPAEPVFTELSTIAKADPDTTVDIFLITARIQRKEFPLALKAIDALAIKAPKDALPDFLRGQIALAQGDARRARESFETALALDPGYYRASERLAAMDVTDGKPEAARSRLEAIAKREPANARVRMALAELAAKSGADADRVSSLLTDAVKASATEVVPRAALIDHLLVQDQGPAALNAAQAALKDLPDHPDLLERLGRAQLATGESNAAITTFNKLATLEPDSAAAQMLLADAYMAKKDVAAAGTSIRRALELAPSSKDVQRAGVVAALRENQPDQALKIARQAQAREPDHADGWVLEGETELAQRHFDAAATAFRKALSKTDNAAAARRLHYTLVTAGKMAEANQMADEWRKSHANDLGFALHLGDLAQARMDFVTAEARYRDILAMQPQNAAALNNLALLLISQQRQDGIPLAEQALKLAPRRAAFMDTLAQGYALAKKMDKAIALQAQAVAAAPGVHSYRLTLAKMYLQAKDLDKARQELSTLVKLGSGFSGRDEVQRILALIGSAPVANDSSRPTPLPTAVRTSALWRNSATWGFMAAGLFAAALLVALLAVLLVAAFAQPFFVIRRSQVIQAPGERILALLKDLRQLERWSLWPPFPQSAKRTFSPATGEARFCAVQHPRHGTKESLEVLATTDPAKVVIEHVGRSGEVEEHSLFTIAADASGGTIVHWSLNGPATYGVRVKGLLSGRNRRLGKALTTSLSRLRLVAETGSAEPEVTPQPPLALEGAQGAT